MRLGLFAAAAVAMLLLSSASAADRQNEQLLVQPSDAPQIRQYIARRALLYIIRGVFDVVKVDDIPSLLAADVDAAQVSGISARASNQLASDLIAEGSYFIVYLRYLIVAGYPAWPDDKPASTYANDSMIRLAPLAESLIGAVLNGEDPIDVLRDAAQVYWWTEGETAPVKGKGDFDARDSLVRAAYSSGASDLEST